MVNHESVDQRFVYAMSSQLVLQGAVMTNAEQLYSEAVDVIRHDSEELQGYARTLLGAQGILTSAAMVSKILWGNEQREGLRTALGVDQRHEILRSRDVRNAVEHIDDRIEKYLAAQPPLSADDPELYWLPWKVRDPQHHLGMLFYEANIFSILGNSVELTQLPGAVADVASHALKWIDDRGLPRYVPWLV